MNLNKVFILGNITRDPEVKTLQNESKLVNFSVATNRFYTDSKDEKHEVTEFHSVVVFGKLAEIAEKYLKLKTLVLIEGRIQTRSWVNPQGVKQYRTEIVAENIQF
jgi:single-strand DNA-binding protein